jgi:serine protease Do
MKKMTIAMLAFVLLPFISIAQDDRKVEKEEIIERKESPEKKEKRERKETQEIIIRQNGDKEIKVKVEIDGDKITINGKPMSEFKDKDITINKRKMTITDGNDMMNWNFSGDGNDWEKWGEAFGKNFEENWNSNENSDGAFLGVTTEKEGDGAKIMEVSKGSAAEKAGLKKGDIITKIDEEKITGPEPLSDMIAFKKPTDEVKVTYKRDGKQSTVKAILGKRKSTSNSFSKPRIHSFSIPHPPTATVPNMEGFNEDIFEMQQNALESAFPSRKKIGLKIQDTEEGNGVKIINVEDSSAAATAGIKKDDIITEINGKKIENTDDAREELVPDEDKKLYKIKINRGGSEMNFDVKIPRKLKTANL